ncbi:LAME_0E11650g1_1 [Lachancea meyersii CBS 8951]|uniref:Nucleolar protein SWM2 n=1 Tax=Lachancea meyersii CBS 8951 TaxID=1266667 RepID=A0A1G4JKT2_9SACH|nr:LAME_0E11650g1_1 [Lachancea meyersii CBS 8951]
MSTVSRDLLLRFLENFTDINVIPVKLTTALPSYYRAIANDSELSKIALEKCDSVLQELSHHSPEIVTRCSQLRAIIEASEQPSNLIQEVVNIQNTTDLPFLGREQHMANLIIEEIDLVDYIDEND